VLKKKQGHSPAQTGQSDVQIRRVATVQYMPCSSSSNLPSASHSGRPGQCELWIRQCDRRSSCSPSTSVFPR